MLRERNLLTAGMLVLMTVTSQNVVLAGGHGGGGGGSHGGGNMGGNRSMPSMSQMHTGQNFVNHGQMQTNHMPTVAKTNFPNHTINHNNGVVHTANNSFNNLHASKGLNNNNLHVNPQHLSHNSNFSKNSFAKPWCNYGKSYGCWGNWGYGCGYGGYGYCWPSYSYGCGYGNYGYGCGYGYGSGYGCGYGGYVYSPGCCYGTAYATVVQPYACVSYVPTVTTVQTSYVPTVTTVQTTQVAATSATTTLPALSSVVQSDIPPSPAALAVR